MPAAGFRRQTARPRPARGHARRFCGSTGERKQQARQHYDEAWKELVALHHERLAERLAVETHDDAVTFKLGDRLAGVLERGDGRTAETTGWFLWFADACGELETDRGPEWIAIAEAPAQQAMTHAATVLLHDFATDLAKGFTSAVAA